MELKPVSKQQDSGRVKAQNFIVVVYCLLLVLYFLLFLLYFSSCFFLLLNSDTQWNLRLVSKQQGSDRVEAKNPIIVFAYCLFIVFYCLLFSILVSFFRAVRPNGT